MSYALSLGSLHVIADGFTPSSDYCDCKQARDWCAPSFVFSVSGQVGFRTALRHVSSCRRGSCRALRGFVIQGMSKKLAWLMAEECLLGCVHIQPSLYGSRHVTMRRRDFPIIAAHLAKCPKESCAQLRRAILLNIRDALRPHIEKLAVKPVEI